MVTTGMGKKYKLSITYVAKVIMLIVVRISRGKKWSNIIQKDKDPIGYENVININ